MLADMTTALLESRAMPRKSSQPSNPSDEVRCVVNMSREQRQRFKAFCARVGRDIEDVGKDWIMERLLQEERKIERKS